ncbi:nuclear transcription factor Y subunit C-2-like [Vigna unguiculata]|uniref:Nuclear transcription factor Y n=1 Tax=Vigna unguiculata TaxID=3917 RepID=A0A4D6KN96_VIGUN|nr:nuclear transcription factor Y subunit C-2-like [Vigna unguiculata]XP_027930313.1 nuclear transcription factor Y subunit C-2-like [Vigna unguiculata]QCD77087.1 nuclear transcription factor Y [Vigna unguiculata]
MEQNQHGQPGKGIGSAPAQEAHNKNQNQSNPNNPPIQTVGSSVPSSYGLRCNYRHQQQQDQMEEKVKSFWAQQRKEIEESTDIRSQHSVPLSRIKKIMKTDPDVKLVAAETPVVFSKACELFIMELTMKAWANAEDNNRRTIKKCDIASAIAKTDVFDFLDDIAPLPGNHKNTVMDPLVAGNAPTPTQNVPYMPPPQHVAGPPPPYVAPTTLHQQNPPPSSDD